MSVEEQADPPRPRKRLTPQQRRFAREVGGIVVAVLIALGIGEIADSIRWRFKTADTMRAIRAELANSAGVFEERALVQPCLDRRLARVATLVREARRTGRLPSIGEIGRPPFRPLPDAAWSVASSTESLFHMDEEEAKSLALLYAQMRGGRERVLEEQELWATLRVLEDSPGPVSNELLAQVEVTLARVRFETYFNGLNAAQQFEAIGLLGVRPNYVVIFDREAPRQELLKIISERTACKPLKVDGKAIA